MEVRARAVEMVMGTTAGAVDTSATRKATALARPEPK
jgi:hypothetical protein